MISLLYKLLPMLLSITLSQFIYLKIDEKYGVTNKISLKLKVSQEWKPFFCICSMMLMILIVGILGMVLDKFIKVEIPDILFFILCGIFSGVGIGITNKIGTIK